MMGQGFVEEIGKSMTTKIILIAIISFFIGFFSEEIINNLWLSANLILHMIIG